MWVCFDAGALGVQPPVGESVTIPCSVNWGGCTPSTTVVYAIGFGANPNAVSWSFSPSTLTYSQTAVTTTTFLTLTVENFFDIAALGSFSAVIVPLPGLRQGSCGTDVATATATPISLTILCALTDCVVCPSSTVCNECLNTSEYYLYDYACMPCRNPSFQVFSLEGSTGFAPVVYVGGQLNIDLSYASQLQGVTNITFAYSNAVTGTVVGRLDVVVQPVQGFFSSSTYVLLPYINLPTGQYQLTATISGTTTNDVCYTSATVGPLHFQVQDCPLDQYPDVGYALCLPCPAECTACTGETSCQGCVSGFYVSSDASDIDNTCDTCPNGCASCTGPNSCQTCFAGFDLVPIQSHGFAVPSHPGHLLVSTLPVVRAGSANQATPVVSAGSADQATCQPCAAGTYSAGGQGVCLNCPTGTFSANQASACTNCPSECTACTDAQTCQACVQGFTGSACQIQPVNFQYTGFIVNTCSAQPQVVLQAQVNYSVSGVPVQQPVVAFIVVTLPKGTTLAQANVYLSDFTVDGSNFDSYSDSSAALTPLTNFETGHVTGNEQGLVDDGAVSIGAGSYLIVAAKLFAGATYTEQILRLAPIAFPSCCSNGCASCTSIVNCTVCDPGFLSYVSGVGSSTATTCVITCPVGSYNSGAGTCLSCPLFCGICSSASGTDVVTCQQCVGGFGLAPNGQCLQCAGETQTYSYYYSGDECMVCAPYCSVDCDFGGACPSCITGYAPNAHGICQQVVTVTTTVATSSLNVCPNVQVQLNVTIVNSASGLPISGERVVFNLIVLPYNTSSSVADAYVEALTISESQAYLGGYSDSVVYSAAYVFNDQVYTDANGFATVTLHSSLLFDGSYLVVATELFATPSLALEYQVTKIPAVPLPICCGSNCAACATSTTCVTCNLGYRLAADGSCAPVIVPNLRLTSAYNIECTFVLVMTAVLSAPAGSSPLQPGQIITFSSEGDPLCSAPTDANGMAMCQASFGEPTIGTIVRAEYIGNATLFYMAPATAASLQSTFVPCTLCNPGFEPNGAEEACVACGSGTVSTSGTSCSVCSAGQVPNVGQSVCIPCPPGTSAQNGDSTCSACGVGTYAFGSGNTICVPCPLGSVALGPAATACVACAAGTTNDSISSSCVACSPGSFSSSSNSTYCTLCAVGSSQPVSGQTGCNLCLPGNFTIYAGQASCLSCSSVYGGGYVQPNAGQSFCSACNVGTYPTSDQSVCLACPTGEYSPMPEASCQTCPPGQQANNAASSCVDCSPGTFHSSTSGPVCLSCHAGFYAPLAGSTECIPCSAGNTSVSPFVTCTPCAAGSFAATPGSSACSPCVGSTFSSSAGATACQACDGNAFAADNHMTCLCDTGYFGNGRIGGCSACPAGTYNVNVGQTDVAACIPCTAGYASSTVAATSGSVCVACLAGQYANANSSACLPCLNDTYSPVPASVSCALCLTTAGGQVVLGALGNIGCICDAGYFGTTDATCSPCSSGSFSASSNASSCVTCPVGSFAFGLQSTQCSECAAGSASPFTGSTTCSACTGNTYSAGLGAGTCTSCALNGVANPTHTGCYCPAGFSGDGVTSCSPCQPGFFASSVDSSICSPCLAGSFAAFARSTSCAICDAGSYSNAGAFVCTLCGPGTDQSQSGQSSCTTCAPGSFSVRDSTSCTACASNSQVNTTLNGCSCDAGYYGGAAVFGSTAGQGCTACTAGKYSSLIGASSSSTCLPCAAGTYSPIVAASSSTQCTPCPAGSFSGVVGATSRAQCLACAVGSYSPTLGTSSCLPCANGYYSAIQGATVCVRCATNGQSNAIRSSCVCSAGSYGNGITLCTNCIAGYASSIVGATTTNVCQTCPIGSFSSVAGSVSCTPCTGVFYSTQIGSTTCRKCAVSSTGTNTVGLQCWSFGWSLFFGEGWFVGWPSEWFNVVDWQSEGWCDWMQQGWLSPANQACNTWPSITQGNTGCACNAGYYGPNPTEQCYACAAGYYSAQIGATSAGTCAPCSPGTESSLPASTTCSACTGQTYSSLFYATSCATCPVNRVVQASSYPGGGNVACNCPRGEYIENGQCSKCNPNLHSFNNPCLTSNEADAAREEVLGHIIVSSGANSFPTMTSASGSLLSLCLAIVLLVV